MCINFISVNNSDAFLTQVLCCAVSIFNLNPFYQVSFLFTAAGKISCDPEIISGVNPTADAP